MIRTIKITSIIFFILVIFVIYNSFYFDIPKSEIISKHAVGASEFLELADGSKIHFRDEGNKEGEILVMVHGFNGSLFNYEPLVPYLSNEYRLISLDLPAHGLTGAVNSDLYNQEAYEKVIEEVVGILEVDKFYLVGHSMGGMIAWRYALSNLDQLKGLIIIGSAFFANEQEFNDFQSINAPPLAFELIESKFFIRLLEFLTPRILVKEGVSQTVYDQSIVTDELVDQFHDIILMEGTRVAIGMLAEDLGKFRPLELNYDNLRVSFENCITPKFSKKCVVDPLLARFPPNFCKFFLILPAASEMKQVNVLHGPLLQLSVGDSAHTHHFSRCRFSMAS